MGSIQQLGARDPAWATRPWWPKEPWQNNALASLGTASRSAPLRAAVIDGLFPGLLRACSCGAAVELAESGNGPDWNAVCARPGHASTLASAEHKPRGAAAHYKPCSAAEFATAATAGLILVGPGPGLAGAAPRGPQPLVTCGAPHPWASCHLQWPHKGVLGGDSQLALPQIVVDAVRLGHGVTLVTDRGSATEVYKTRAWDIDIDPVPFPIRTTASLLDSIAHRLPADLPPDERRAVRRAFTLLWARASWPTHDALSRRAKQWLAPWAKTTAWIGFSTKRVP